jgi:D-lactate dehydrogenase (cytochrome)
VPVARIEVANAIQMDAINKYSKLELPVAPTLWLEFHGTVASVAEQAEMVQKITADHGGANFSWTTRPEDRQKLWRARHDVVYADRAMRPGGQIFTPMYVCRFRGWPNVLSRPRKMLQPRSCQH